MSTAAALLTAALERMPAGREQQAPPEPPLMLSGGPGGKDSGSLPRFFFRRHVETGAVGRELARTCHGVLRRSIADALPSNDDLDLLWDALCAAAPAAPGTDARRASFAQFCAASNNLGPKFKPYFRPSLFLCFGRDELGRIDALQFFNFVLRKGQEMQTYIQEMMPLLNLRNMNPSFTKFYLCTAVRKFMFFLDPLRRGRVAIESILLSPILTELFELRDPDLPRDFEHSNWFSSYSALRVYGLFLNLDVDRNGMISRKELTKYRGESICRVFLDRVFQEYQTYSGEMDFNAFLDFVLAMENMHSVPSITYCFKLLDINGQGYLDRGSMTIFFRVRYFKNALESPSMAWLTL
nr:Serine/threonine-protein phosphatase 2A regulatory subunit B'' subunit gamma [Polyrhizophydium stewartii]